MINADRLGLWRVDASAARTSADDWYVESGRMAYQAARRAMIDQVREVLALTDDLRRIEPAMLRRTPSALATLRMSTAPPIARERLAGLSRTERPLLTALEQDRLPARVSPSELEAQLARVCAVIGRLLDHDLFGWLDQERSVDESERAFAAMVVADRRCEAVGEQVLRQAERQRQAHGLTEWLAAHGYREHAGRMSELPTGAYLAGPRAGDGSAPSSERGVDTVVRPRAGAATRAVVVRALPRPAPGSLTRASAEAALLAVDDVTVVLLIGVADPRFLRQCAAAGQDWVWEHRLDDLSLTGL